MTAHLNSLLVHHAHAFLGRVLDRGEDPVLIEATFRDMVSRPVGQRFQLLLAAHLAHETATRAQWPSAETIEDLLVRFLQVGALLTPEQFAAAVADLGDRWDLRRTRKFSSDLRRELKRAAQRVSLPKAHDMRLREDGVPHPGEATWLWC